MIIKLQRALNNNNVLVYNKDRSFMGEQPATEAMLKLFGNKFKIYAKGELCGDGLFVIDRVVKDRDW